MTENEEERRPSDPPQPAAPVWKEVATAATVVLDLTADVLESGGRDGPAVMARTIAHLLRLAVVVLPDASKR
ncbi:hypothetical protein GCM10022225_51250 [Plantactinospora mayteni]|uniref:Uncharacterized protein n=1 Tax=Plantactinospora mayteni TaxID=566021 RepID=A0ABQ4F458_9ACTN|nr:hypothetical protein Pma05_82680 [Plantactinospora mayteni]